MPNTQRPASGHAPLIAVALTTIALFTISCHSATSYVVVNTPAPTASAPSAVTGSSGADSVVNARFQNVHFHMWPSVSLDLAELTGRMHSNRADRVVSFDDKTSFTLAIDSGSVSLAMDDLGALMNTYVFAYEGAPLKGLSFETKDGHLIQRGTMHKVVDIPFEMTGEVSTTPAGEIRVHPISMKICTIPGQGLMEALGITLDKLLDVRKAKGVRVAGNDLLLDPTKLLPPPAISGHLTGVRVEPGRLVQVFGSSGPHLSAESLAPDTAAANYMLFRGGTLQFGKLFMVHAEMQVVDLSPGDPFDFDIGQYHAQLVAGSHRTLPNDGLLVFMPDLSNVTPRGSTPPGRLAPRETPDQASQRSQPR